MSSEDQMDVHQEVEVQDESMAEENGEEEIGVNEDEAPEEAPTSEVLEAQSGESAVVQKTTKAKKAPTGFKRSYDQLKDAPGAYVEHPGIDLTREEVLAFLPNLTWNKIMVTWILMDRKTKWKLAKMTAYIQKARGIEKDIRSTLTKRVIPLIREMAGHDSIEVDDFIKGIAVLEPRPFPILAYGEDDPERENPLLRELGQGVVAKPSGDEAGVFTALVMLAERTNADWRLKDCARIMEHLDLLP